MPTTNRFFLQRLEQDAKFAESNGRMADAFFLCDVKAALDRISELEQSQSTTSNRIEASSAGLKILSTGNTHDLKCWPSYFDVILSGVKPFEIRSEADRQFAVGDVLLLREWDPASDMYTGRTCGRRITYILRGFPGIEPGYAVLGFPNT